MYINLISAVVHDSKNNNYVLIRNKRNLCTGNVCSFTFSCCRVIHTPVIPTVTCHFATTLYTIRYTVTN